MKEGQAMSRCPGWGDGSADWLEECHDCQRRTVAGGDLMTLPAIVGLWCENYEPPDRPKDQRLRELARRLQGDLEAGA